MQFVILGGGSAAARCAQIVLGTDGAELVLCLSDPARDTGSALLNFATSNNLPFVQCHSVGAATAHDALIAARPDYLLSVNNYQILKPRTLDVPARGSINFHHSALPAYAGLNACSWALLNGEREHGITWHLVDTSIDGGDILAQRTFPIAPDATALRLLGDVVRHGVLAFAELLPTIIGGKFIAQAQRGRRSYYRASDLPFDGWFPLKQPWDVLERLSRAIDFHPLPPAFYLPRISFNSKELQILRFEMRRLRHSYSMGHVVASEPGRAKIAVEDGMADIEFSDVLIEPPVTAILTSRS